MPIGVLSIFACSSFEPENKSCKQKKSEILSDPESNLTPAAHVQRIVDAQPSSANNFATLEDIEARSKMFLECLDNGQLTDNGSMEFWTCESNNEKLVFSCSAETLQLGLPIGAEKAQRQFPEIFYENLTPYSEATLVHKLHHLDSVMCLDRESMDNTNDLFTRLVEKLECKDLLKLIPEVPISSSR